MSRILGRHALRESKLEMGKEQIVKYLRSNALKDKYELDIKGVHGFDLSSAKEDAYYENFYKTMRMTNL